LIRDVVDETNKRLHQHGVTTLSQARNIQDPIVAFSEEVAPQINRLLDFMMERVYRGPVVARQNYRARHILRELFEALLNNPTLLPVWVQPLVEEGSSRAPLEIARFLAGLTDRGATDLYAELFEPSERAMGHRIV
jgi:dGTPase